METKLHRLEAAVEYLKNRGIARTRICTRYHIYIYRAQPAESRRGEPPSIRHG